jgi:hypothetical protein
MQETMVLVKVAMRGYGRAARGGISRESWDLKEREEVEGGEGGQG